MSEAACCRLAVRDGSRTLALECPALADERELAALVAERGTEYPDAWVMAELREEDLCYAYCLQPGEQVPVHAVFYNDFDDYEDDIELGSPRWLAAVGCPEPVECAQGR